MPAISERGYANPKVLVSTEWVADHLEDPNVRIVESNEDPLLYATNHIPGAVEVDWTNDLNQQIVRDYLEQEEFQNLMRRIGVEQDTTVVFYGDKSNWWACYAFWIFELFDHASAKIMDGGRLKWEQEGRRMTVDVPSYAPTLYSAPRRDDHRVRAFRHRVEDHVMAGGKLVDVRSVEEFTGKRLHMPEYPNEGALRGGHIPGAVNVPWELAANEDGTFKTADELRAIYVEGHGLREDDDIVAYCRIGERSSHTWFVLQHLLGFKTVRNYDGSWTEWGNLVGAPIER